ncbi:helix-turn-helix domain-containing protein [Microbacterium sp. 10M-3C3]|uniref:ArsR/SmtB family transcription factor n=1 Tax=Microbacterium sp. 10M-3C3 TaxID=2483401 RepID=UPI001F0C812F|nr:helix-turn-helix domain-containing protein [Microbacterium sp. 10M-3C3]
MTETPSATPPERRDRVLDAGALRAMAHPLRVKIFDILSQYGPQTASSLASTLGESSGATSYHLRALAKHDLIREVADRGTGRERWWERPAGGIQFGDPESVRSPSGRAAMYLVMNETLNRRHQLLLQFVGTAAENEPKRWQEGTLVSTATARLTPAQMADLSHRMQALIDETVDAYRDQRGDDVRPVTMRADVFPLPPEGALP